MNFDLTDDQAQFRGALETFLARVLKPEYVRNCDDEEIYPYEAYEAMIQAGFAGVPFPEEYGGAGGNDVHMCLLMEHLARGMNALANWYLVSVVNGGKSILAYGSEEQKRHYLPRLISGEIKFAFALTESGAGSDALGLRTSARKVEGGFLVAGSKVFCTGANEADYILTVVRTDASVVPAEGISVLIIDTKSQGITIKKLKKISMKSIHSCEIFFSEVFVPDSQLLGALNSGWKNVLGTLERERFTAAARSVGVMQAVLNDSINYAKERRQFNRPIGDFQMVKDMIAGIKADLDAARLMTYRVAWLQSTGRSCPAEASAAKLFATEACMRAAHAGVQIMGGYGVMTEYDMQRHFRDAKLHEIGSGTSQIQKLIIAKELGL